MYCLRWWIALFLLPFPSAPPAFLILFLISYAYATKPCVYCSGILIALFTSSCYWYSGSPSSEDYYGRDSFDLSGTASTPTAALTGETDPVEQARSHLANLHAARITRASITTDSSVKVEGEADTAATAQGSKNQGDNQNLMPFTPDIRERSQTEPHISTAFKNGDQDSYRPNWCWLDLRGTGTGTGWWEPLRRPGSDSRRRAAAAIRARHSNPAKYANSSTYRTKLKDFFLTPTARLFPLSPLFQKLYHSLPALPALPPKIFIGVPNSGIGIYLNLSLGF